MFVLCSGLVGELCGLAFWRRQDSSVQNDADVASAETAEGFGSLSGHEGKQNIPNRLSKKPNKPKKEKQTKNTHSFLYLDTPIEPDFCQLALFTLFASSSYVPISYIYIYRWCHLKLHGCRHRSPSSHLKWLDDVE